VFGGRCPPLSAGTFLIIRKAWVSIRVGEVDRQGGGRKRRVWRDTPPPLLPMQVRVYIISISIISIIVI